MKLNRLETHDRLGHFIKDQSINIWKGAEDCLKVNPLSLQLQERSPYIYIFAHPRTHEDGVTKVMYWQPRLTRPKPQTNSYLFRAQSKSDNIEVCWLIPPKELWSQYNKGLVTESDLVGWSINQYKYRKGDLAKNDDRDLPENICQDIYRKVIHEHREKLKQDSLAASSVLTLE